VICFRADSHGARPASQACYRLTPASMASSELPDNESAVLLSPLGSGDELEYLSSATLTRRKDFLEAEEEVRTGICILAIGSELHIKVARMPLLRRYRLHASVLRRTELMPNHP